MRLRLFLCVVLMLLSMVTVAVCGQAIQTSPGKARAGSGTCRLLTVWAPVCAAQ